LPLVAIKFYSALKWRKNVCTAVIGLKCSDLLNDLIHGFVVVIPNLLVIFSFEEIVIRAEYNNREL
jgi:hypothetical protein